MHTPVTYRWLPVWALLFGAASWGVLWYPFRLLNAHGLSAPMATMLSYSVTLALGGILFRHAWKEFASHPLALALIAFSAGVTNVAFLVAIMHGEVVRIVLLFYMAPLWTVLFARILLKERLTPTGVVTMLLALVGAIIMLWQPALGFPAPRNADEWLGMLAGIAFAGSNVLVKRTHYATTEAKSLASVLGVFLVALPVAAIIQPLFGNGNGLTLVIGDVGLIVVLGILLLATSMSLQFGLSHISANRAAVILLFELVIAATAAHWLAGEISRVQDFLGGAMIVAAGLVAALRRH